MLEVTGEDTGNTEGTEITLEDTTPRAQEVWSSHWKALKDGRSYWRHLSHSKPFLSMRGACTKVSD